MSKVKVIIVSYNQDAFVEDCLKSVLCQTYNNIKVVVVDNFSSSEDSAFRTRSVAEAYGVEFIQRKDRSLTRCLNSCLIDTGDYKYINFIAADDIMVHNKIELQVDFLESENANIAACFGNAIRINDGGKLLGVNTIVDNRILDFNFVFKNRPDLYAPTALYKVSCLNEVGGFSVSHNIEDLSIYLKLTKFGYKLASIDKPLVFYRIHSGNTHAKYMWMMKEKIKIWDEYSGEPEYIKGLQNIYLEHFSNFGSTDKIECIKLLPKVIRRADSKYFWLGVLRFLFDHRKY